MYLMARSILFIFKTLENFSIHISSMQSKKNIIKKFFTTFNMELPARMLKAFISL
jgi:hypothetical protein